MIRYGAASIPSPQIEFIDETPAYLQMVADRHNIERFMSADGTRWNVVLPLPAIDLVLVYRADVERVAS